MEELINDKDEELGPEDLEAGQAAAAYRRAAGGRALPRAGPGAPLAGVAAGAGAGAGLAHPLSPAASERALWVGRRWTRADVQPQAANTSRFAARAVARSANKADTTRCWSPPAGL
jgi:hypothetical protein